MALFYSSVGIGPSNRFSFGPTVPLFISNVCVIFQIIFFRACSALAVLEYGFS
jgi:hypothetical protein